MSTGYSLIVSNEGASTLTVTGTAMIALISAPRPIVAPASIFCRLIAACGEPGFAPAAAASPGVTPCSWLSAGLPATGRTSSGFAESITADPVVHCNAEASATNSLSDTAPPSACDGRADGRGEGRDREVGEAQQRVAARDRFGRREGGCERGDLGFAARR